MNELQMILILVILLTGNVIAGWHQHQHNIPVSPQQSQFPSPKSGFGQSREQRLVDYPFTVEFVPKNQPILSRSGVPLVDYPFTISYELRRNPAYKGKRGSSSGSSSLISNLGLFQSTDQYQLLRGGWYRE
ncbi:hypothetical protein Ocin01_04894 [Orchesella cincta]|uniref:Uncharacterized protein n=1 Tax=Orchesella cincta TaxID=48709 RepID=A0A1D2N940_ORCCI|nr:hypothetical protein Ocin01_04894 [Orchesella cincta]